MFRPVVFVCIVMHAVMAGPPYARQTTLQDKVTFEYTVKDNFVDFQITGVTDGWVSWGVQSNQDRVQMVGSEAYVCTVTDGQPLIKAWQLVAKNTPRVLSEGKSPQIERLFSQLEGELSNGRTTCRARRFIGGTDPVSRLLRTKRNNVKMILAYGDTKKVNRHVGRGATELDFTPFEDEVVPIFGQCGGFEQKIKCCETGTKCFRKDDFFWQCLPSCGQNERNFGFSCQTKDGCVSDGLLNLGGDCFNECGSKSGFCTGFCGVRGKCCRKGFNGGEKGCRADEGGENRHMCVGSQLENADQDCFGACDSKSGPCGFCGTGKCCRRGFNGGENGCRADEGGARKHVCVADSTAALRSRVSSSAQTVENQEDLSERTASEVASSKLRNPAMSISLLGPLVVVLAFFL